MLLPHRVRSGSSLQLSSNCSPRSSRAGPATEGGADLSTTQTLRHRRGSADSIVADVTVATVRYSSTTGGKAAVGGRCVRGLGNLSTVRFARRARRDAPRAPGGEVSLQAPPDIPRATPGNLLMKLLPLVMVAAMIGMVALMFGSGMARSPMALVFPLMMMVSMIGMLANSGRGGGAKTAETNEDRKDYLRYLDTLRRDVAETGSAQRRALEWTHPDPALLWTLVGTVRMWERRPTDATSATCGWAGADSDRHQADRSRNRSGRGSRTRCRGVVAPLRARALGGAGTTDGRIASGIRVGRYRRRPRGIAATGPSNARAAVHLPRTRRTPGRGGLRTGHCCGVGVGQVAAARSAPGDA